MGCDQHVRYTNGCKGIWNTRNTVPLLELELEPVPVPVPCRVCLVLILLRCKVRWRIPFHLMTVGWYCYCLVFPGSLTVSHQQLEAITECHHRCEICLSTSPPQRIIISLELTLIPMPLSMTMTMLTEFCYVAFVFFVLLWCLIFTRSRLLTIVSNHVLNVATYWQTLLHNEKCLLR